MDPKKKTLISELQHPPLLAEPGGYHGPQAVDNAEPRPRHSSVQDLSRALAGVLDPEHSPYSLPPVEEGASRHVVQNLLSAIHAGGDEHQRMLAYRADALSAIRHDIEIWRERRDLERKKLNRFNVLESVALAVTVCVAFVAIQVGLDGNFWVKWIVMIVAAIGGGVTVGRRLLADPGGRRADYIRRLDAMITIAKAYRMVLEHRSISLDTLQATIATLQVAHQMLDTRNRDPGA